MMRWVFGGAVFVGAVAGVAAAARGVSLIVSGIHERARGIAGVYLSVPAVAVLRIDQHRAILRLPWSAL